MANAPLHYRSGGETTLTVVDPRFGTNATPTQPAGWGTSVSAPVGGSRVTVAPSGDTTGATDRANIQAAIDAATETHTELTNLNAYFSGGQATVIELVGKYTINGALVMKQGVWLKGQSWLGSTIHLAPGSNSSMITWEPKTYWTGISDLQLDGHGEQQTGGGPAVNCDARGAVTIRGDSCTAPFIQRIMVTYAYDSAFLLNAVETRTADCYAFRPGKHGFIVSASDSFMHGCASGDSRDSGFLIDGGQHHISNCKSWWSGFYQPDRTRLATKPSTITNPVPGFKITGNDNMIVNCDAQDSSGDGFFISGPGNYLRNVVSDDSLGNHFHLWGNAYGNTIEGHCRSVHMGAAKAAVRFETWTATRRNRVTIDWNTATFNGVPRVEKGVVVSGADAANALTGNVVRIGTPEVVHTTGYADTITPDPIMGGVDVTLAGPVTIANTVRDRSIYGTDLTITLRQDATGGRTVAWGSEYVGMTPPDLGPSKVNIWRIRRMVDRWVQTGFTAY